MKKSFLKKATAMLTAIPITALQLTAPVFATDTPLIQFTTSDLTEIDVAEYESEWNLKIESGLLCCDSADFEINLDILYNSIISNSGSNADNVKYVLDSIENEKCTYENSIFTFSGTIEDLNSIIIDESGKTFSENLEAILGENVLSAMSAEIEFKVDFSDIYNSKNINLSCTVKTESGNYTFSGENSIFEYISEQLSILNESVVLNLSEDDTISEVNALFNSYIEKIIALKNTLSNTIDIEGTLTGDNLADILETIQNNYPEYADKLPLSAESVSDMMSESLENIFAQLNETIIPEGVSIDINADEVADVLDSLTDVTLTIENGTVKVIGTLEDNQTDDVKTYFVENPEKLAELVEEALAEGLADETGLELYSEDKILDTTAKVIEVSLPLSVSDIGSGDIYYNVWRTYTFADEGEIVTTSVSEESTTTTITTTTTVSETTTITTETTVAETSDDNSDDDSKDCKGRRRQGKRNRGKRHIKKEDERIFLDKNMCEKENNRIFFESIEKCNKNLDIKKFPENFDKCRLFFNYSAK